jgi:glycosyltransferase involved in cell wall biosynthesis
VRILCLTDFPVLPGDRWFWDYVPENVDAVDFLTTTVQDRYAGWGKLVAYYPRLLRLGRQALRQAQRGDYDLIVAWEGKSGFPLALLRQLTGVKSPPLAILAFSIRGPLKSFSLIQRYGVRGADYFSVPTQAERSHYTHHLRLSPERVRHLPVGIHDVYGGQFGKEPGDYFYSGGRSGRDYVTLFKAVQGLKFSLVVNARPFNLRRLDIPANVQVNDLLPHDQYRDQNWNARFVVVPLQSVNEAVGLTAILHAMAAGKAVICTGLPGPSEYILPGETGLLVPEGDVAALRDAIVYLWERPELCRNMGHRARAIYAEHYTFSAFSHRVVAYLHDIAGT